MLHQGKDDYSDRRMDCSGGLAVLFVVDSFSFCYLSTILSIMMIDSIVLLYSGDMDNTDIVSMRLDVPGTGYSGKWFLHFSFFLVYCTCSIIDDD